MRPTDTTEPCIRDNGRSAGGGTGSCRAKLSVEPIKKPAQIVADDRIDAGIEDGGHTDTFENDTENGEDETNQAQWIGSFEPDRHQRRKIPRGLDAAGGNRWAKLVRYGGGCSMTKKV